MAEDDTDTSSDEEEPLVGAGKHREHKHTGTNKKWDFCLGAAIVISLLLLAAFEIYRSDVKTPTPTPSTSASTSGSSGSSALSSKSQTVQQTSASSTSPPTSPILLSSPGTLAESITSTAPTSKLTGNSSDTATGSSAANSSAAVTATKSGYSALVAFGASYTDNAHARASEYNSTFRSYGYGGRYTNGPVEVEYMTNTTTIPALPSSSQNGSIQLLDYAYGGSMIDNDLSGGTSPATKDQIAQFVSDVKAGTVNPGNGRLLVYFNSGINPLTVIFSNILSAKASSASLSSAATDVTKNIAAVSTQLQDLSKETSITQSGEGMDFLIVGIPPLDIVPSLTYTANGDTASLAALKTLVAQFNIGLSTFATSFSGQLSSGSKATFFDLAALWQDFYANGATYGMTVSPITSTCYDSSTGSTCDNPTTYLYFDSLHPVTSCHLIMAEKMNTALS